MNSSVIVRGPRRGHRSIYFKAIGDNDVPDGKQKHTTVRYPLQFN